MSDRLAWLLPVVPALTALLLLTTGRRQPGRGRPLAVTSAAATLAVAAALGLPQQLVQTTSQLVPGAGVTLGTAYDGLAGILALVVTVVGLCVQLYSTTYLRDDPRYPSYAALVALFTAAMLLVVVSGDLLVLLVGWEVMGLCSYVLIGHDTASPVAARAAITAFLTTRFADLFFTAGLFVLGVGAGSFRISTVIAAHLSHPVVVTGGLLVLAGCLGKSAQFPLQTWLPDAMAGPTPVSALIHAATMVAAGVYVVARLYPVVAGSAVTLDALAVISAVTMLLGALCALAQDDLKRVLAWSTVSQLAYMYGALAVGGYTAGLFHLVTHAAFKALLFLAAGSVIHAVGTNEIASMGGLRRRLPFTFAAMTVGLAALAGLPPFAGFVSKDAVLGAAYDAAHGRRIVPVGNGFAWLVWVSAVITAAVTVAYCVRLWLRVFLGAPRAEVRHGEPSWVERAPVAALAVGALVLGGLGLQRDGAFAHRLGVLPGLRPHGGFVEFAVGGYDQHPNEGLLFRQVQRSGSYLGLSGLQVLLALVLAAAVIAVVVVRWRSALDADPTTRLLGRTGPPLAAGLNMDLLYITTLIRPIRDRIAPAAGRIDAVLIDGSVEGTARLAHGTGALLRRLENGNLQAYVTGLAIGAVALAVGVAIGVR